jgi:hypothetical protein
MYPRMTIMLARISSILVMAGIAASVLAEPIAEAEDALRKRDPASAIRILEQAAGAGDLAAKGRLASYLRTFPAPYRDVERACKLAREASDGGDAIGSVTRAECLIAGTEKAEQPFVLARELARRALKSGSSAGGFTLYLAFTVDPRYNYSSPGGGADNAKYNALAAMPVSARADQVEAFDGLADALRAGHVNAATIALAYLVDSSAPGNIDRVLGLAGLLQRGGEQIPERLLPSLRLGQDIKRLGGTTHASISAFGNAYKSAFLGATLRIRGLGESVCDAKEIKLVQISAEPVSNAEYLPISKAPLVNTYLVRGNWLETWTFSGCQKTVPIQMNFTSDGWSGAKFQTAPYKPGDPQKPQ